MTGLSLTHKQRDALPRVANGDVQKHRFGYGAWRITGPVHPTVVGRLISVGLVSWTSAPNTNDAEIAILTDLGRAHLSPDQKVIR